MTKMDRPPHPTDGGYRPTVTDEYAQQMRCWHERTFQSARARAGSGENSEYLGLTLEVPPEVMPITPLSDLLGTAVLAEVNIGGPRAGHGNRAAV